MKRSGISLLELLVATLIVALAMVPLIGLFSSGAREVAFDEYYVTAQGIGLTLVERTIEELNVGGFVPLQRSHAAAGKAGFSVDNFRWDLDARPVDGAGWMWQITVNLDWRLPTDPSGVKHSLSLDRLLSRPDACFTGKHAYRRIMDPGL
jgi:hypothetical protein